MMIIQSRQVLRLCDVKAVYFAQLIFLAPLEFCTCLLLMKFGVFFSLTSSRLSTSNR